MSNTNTLVELVNPFVAAAFSTLSMILNESPTRGQLSAKPIAVTSHQVNIVIGVTGDIVGHVIIGMSLTTADKTASIMIGQQVTTFDELAASAVGELGNMICGNGLLNLSQQGHTCDLTPPTVIRGKRHEQGPTSSAPRCLQGPDLGRQRRREVEEAAEGCVNLMANDIRVLVVDDSALMRKMVTDMLNQDPKIIVVGQARDGIDALEKAEALHPDVITLDVEMPNKDGLETLKELMQRRPTPVVMLSSLTQAGAETTLKCLQLGAIDFVGKPSGSISLDVDRVRGELLAKVKVASGHSTRLKSSNAVVQVLATTQANGSMNNPSATKGRPGSIGLLVIGSSTGGPKALHTVLPALPKDLGIPIVVIQHLPETFTAMLASRLDQDCALEVREVKVGDPLNPGVVHVAAGGKHLKYDSSGRAEFGMEPPIHGVRPAIDVTIASLLPRYGSKMLGVLLTGMGKDGAMGMKAICDAGGWSICQNEESCVVFGMPKAAIELGAASQILPLDQIAGAVVEAVRGANIRAAS